MREMLLVCCGYVAPKVTLLDPWETLLKYRGGERNDLF